MRTIAIVGWVVILGAALAWQSVGLARDDWPTMSDLLRVPLRSTVGRSALVGLWLWIGWHLFVRTWGSIAEGST
ncbi:MAG: hypothetical protein KatS3mg013_1209 [Actinomycetota bacterium]|jgi:hypothetical protein|nr:MAG: hypothetical protein KatS3mg013_1209 [Actinomycetota bacterium]